MPSERDTANITLVAFAPEHETYGDDDMVESRQAAEQRILHPESREEAVEMYGELALQAHWYDPEDRREWEVSILFDGREAKASEQERWIIDTATASYAAAIKAAEEKVQFRNALKERYRQRKQEEKDRREYDRLKKKYEASFRQEKSRDGLPG